MKRIQTKGLVIKEVKVGEGNKILTILTPHNGKVQAGANGVRSFKSKLSAGCSLFGFSDFVLREGREMFSVSSAESVDSFYSIRNDVEKIALATYFCDLLNLTVAPGQPAGDILKLAVNTLFYLSGNNDHRITKPVFELRLMMLSGFAPILDKCGLCQNADDISFFSAEEGAVLCSGCGKGEKISPAVLNAMRYILSCDSRKIFSFHADKAVMENLARVCGQYAVKHIGKRPKSLDFLESLY